MALAGEMALLLDGGENVSFPESKLCRPSLRPVNCRDSLLRECLFPGCDDKICEETNRRQLQTELDEADLPPAVSRGRTDKGTFSLENRDFLLLGQKTLKKVKTSCKFEACD